MVNVFTTYSRYVHLLNSKQLVFSQLYCFILLNYLAKKIGTPRHNKEKQMHSIYFSEFILKEKLILGYKTFICNN